VRTADLELDLDVFAGPFDLLLAIVLREEISLLEVELGAIVLAYLEHLDEEGELDLEAATEFLVLIAALLELKSRLMLPAEDEPELDLGPEEAADELLARMLEYRRYKDAGEELSRVVELLTRLEELLTVVRRRGIDFGDFLSRIIVDLMLARRGYTLGDETHRHARTDVHGCA